MATIKCSELENLKTQFNALINTRCGRNRLFDVIYRIIINDQQPYPSFFDINMYGVGIGGIQPAEVRTINETRKNILLSEVPSIKSLWYRINYELADYILKIEELLNGTTKDEIRILQAYANTLSADDKQKLLNLLLKIEPATNDEKFDLPGISE